MTGSSPAESNPHPVVKLAAGDYQASIASYGGGIKSLTFTGHPLTETYPDDAYPPMACGVVLAPWPNRTEDGLFEFGGKRYQLELTEPANTNAIHGFARTGWTVVETSPSETTLELVIANKPGWPWTITLRAHYLLADTGLHATYTASAAENCPYAFGLHTYLSAWGAPTDDCVLTAPLAFNQPLNERNLPVGDLVPAETIIPEITTGAPVKDLQLDHCFRADTSDSARSCTLLNPEGNGVELRTSANLDWFQIFTPGPAIGRDFPGRGRAIAVEPMSAPPNALRSGNGLTVLAPGQPAIHKVSLRALSH